VQTKPLAIPGVPTKRGKFEFPGPDGRPVTGRIKPMRFWDVYPRLEVGGVTHPTGTEAPLGLKIVACLPMLLFAGAALGVLCGLVAIFINFAVIRSGASKVVVVATSIGTLLAGALVYFLAAGAIYAAIGS
jgi:hypothetical protein